MSATHHAEKRDTMLALLDRGLVMVHLDPRLADVIVPDYLAVDPTLRLNIAYGFNLPALEVDDEGIYAVLSFGGVNHGCTVPWEAVYALTVPDAQQDGKMWPSSLPPELAEQAAAMAAAAPPPAPALRVVGADEDVEDTAGPAPAAPEEPAVESEPTPAPSAGRPSLRLVTD